MEEYRGQSDPFTTFSKRANDSALPTMADNWNKTHTRKQMVEYEYLVLCANITGQAAWVEVTDSVFSQFASFLYESYTLVVPMYRRENVAPVGDWEKIMTANPPFAFRDKKNLVVAYLIPDSPFFKYEKIASDNTAAKMPREFRIQWNLGPFTKTAAMVHFQFHPSSF